MFYLDYNLPILRDPYHTVYYEILAFFFLYPVFSLTIYFLYFSLQDFPLFSLAIEKLIVLLCLCFFALLTIVVGFVNFGYSSFPFNSQMSWVCLQYLCKKLSYCGFFHYFFFF